MLFRGGENSTITSLKATAWGPLQTQNCLPFLRCSNAGHTHTASQEHWRCATFSHCVACSSLIVATTISSDSLRKTHGSLSSCVRICQTHLNQQSKRAYTNSMHLDTYQQTCKTIMCSYNTLRIMMVYQQKQIWCFPRKKACHLGNFQIGSLSMSHPLQLHSV